MALADEILPVLENLTARFRGQWKPSNAQECDEVMSMDDVIEYLALTEHVEELNRSLLSEYLSGCGYEFFEGMLMLSDANKPVL